jgi:hypothetical protein
MRKIDVDYEVVYKLYVLEGYSLRELCVKLGLNKIVLQRALKEFGITIRQHSEQKQNEQYRIRNFWKYVVKSNSCWSWLGPKNRRGYGMIGSSLLSAFRTSSHRFSYELHKGKIPDGLFVCHKCDNPECTNPDHLFLGTPLDNMQDKIKKGRQKVAGCCVSKLTEQDVIDIRKDTTSTYSQLAEKYGHKSIGGISAIKNGKSWKHVK